VGRGVPFIDSDTDLKIGNVSSTKQNITSQSGLLAIASDQDTRHYFHNYYATPPTADVPIRGPGSQDGLLTMAPGAPNPFRGSTRIPFSLRHSTHVDLTVFDLSGRRVRGLLDADLSAGDHDRVWDGRDDSGMPVATGIYFARLTADGDQVWQRLARIR
jgi:hypothetical protein